jgi:hypothetical protein
MLILVPLVLGSLGIFVWSLYTILTTPTPVWKEADANQLMWLAVVIVLPLIGSLLFVSVGHRQLAASSRRLAGAPQEVSS